MSHPSPSSFLERTRGAKKIIVVDFGFLGDSVHLVPALWELKKQYPSAEIHTLSATVGAEVLKLAPCVDHAWAFPLTSKSPPWWRHWNIIAELRRQHFDVAFNFNGSDRSIFVTALMRARQTLAYEGGRKHFWNPWLARDWVARRPQDSPVFEQRRRVLAEKGFLLDPPRFDLQVPLEARQWAEKNITGNPVHLSINASSANKEWPLENWVALVQLLLQKDPQVRLAATASFNPREQQRLAELARSLDSPRLQCFAGLPIARLAAVLQCCRLHIGADSGALHLAMALGLPTLTVFRQYAGLAEWIPPGAKHRYLITPCRCIAEHRNDCVARSVCLASISPAQMAGEAWEQLR